jgi:hypothetical protein
MMHRYERFGLWLAVGALAVFTAVNYAAIEDVEAVASDNTARLDMPVVRASVIPGVPEDLRETWRKVTEAADLDPDSVLWLTVPLTNVGYAPAGEVTAALAFGPEIKGVYAYSSEGSTLDESWGGPEIKEGGTGEQAVSVEFDDDLARGERHLLFVALAPADLGPAPYGQEVMRRWATAHPIYWDKIEVTSAEDAWTEDKTTTVSYGVGSADAPLTAEAEPAAPATPAAAPAADATAG